MPGRVCDVVVVFGFVQRLVCRKVGWMRLLNRKSGRDRKGREARDRGMDLELLLSALGWEMARPGEEGSDFRLG